MTCNNLYLPHPTHRTGSPARQLPIRDFRYDLSGTTDDDGRWGLSVHKTTISFDRTPFVINLRRGRPLSKSLRIGFDCGDFFYEIIFLQNMKQSGRFCLVNLPDMDLELRAYRSPISTLTVIKKGKKLMISIPPASASATSASGHPNRQVYPQWLCSCIIKRFNSTEPAYRNKLQHGIGCCVSRCPGGVLPRHNTFMVL